MRFLSTCFFMLSGTLALVQQNTNATYLTLSTIVTKNNNSAFECWQLTEPFQRSAVPGTSGAESLTLGNITNYGYSIIPPRFDGGLHNAPAPQIVHFVSGLAHLTLPFNNSANLWVPGGAGGLLFALDTEGTGHITMYPTDQPTVAITAPFKDGKIPDHIVLADGPCEGKETFI